jgi:hypothetical protein
MNNRMKMFLYLFHATTALLLPVKTALFIFFLFKFLFFVSLDVRQASYSDTED